MKKLGTSVFWSISDETVITPEILRSAGFEKEAPRNDAKTALIKACKVVKRDWEISDEDINAKSDTPKTLKKGDHRRYKDSEYECRIALTRPRITETGYQSETAMTITLMKGSVNRLTFINVSMGMDEFEALSQRVSQEYDRAGNTIDATQLRLLVSRYVTGKCAATSLRAFSGGIYFVAEAYTARLELIKKLFRQLDRGQAMFETFPIYDDNSGVAESVENHVTTAFEKELAEFIANLQTEVQAGISKRVLTTRMESVEAIKTKIRNHEDHLRSKADVMKKKTDRWLGLLEVRLAEAKGKTVEPFDLMAELEAIDVTITAARRRS